MIVPLMLALSAAAAPVTGAQDPTIGLDLSSDGRYVTGDKARVKVRAAEDGYLVVLRTDVNGWVRVMFPLDPTDDDFIHGGRDVELRGRAGRESFQTGLTEGAGTVLAARSAESFHFDRFIRDGHWNYRALDSLRAGQGADPQSILLGLVQQMAGDSHFDYDVAGYSVTDRERAEAEYGPYPPAAYPYGPPSWYDPYWYDPFFYSAFYYSPLYFGPYCYGCFPRFYFSIGFVHPFRPFRYGYGGYLPGYRPRGAFGFSTGVRVSPAPPSRGAAPGARGGGGRRVTYSPARGAAPGAAGYRRAYSPAPSAARGYAGGSAGGARSYSVRAPAGGGAARVGGGGGARGGGGGRRR